MRAPARTVLPQPDSRGIVWPDAQFLNTDLPGMPRWARVKAYGQRLAEANPHLSAHTPNDRLMVGVHLAAHNARVLLQKGLGTNGPDVSTRGRNHRHGSIFDVEWSCGIGQRLSREDLLHLLGPLVEPIDGQTTLQAEAFRQTFGGVAKLSCLERTPSTESMVRHEQALLSQVFDNNEGLTHADQEASVQPVDPHAPRHRL